MESTTILTGIERAKIADINEWVVILPGLGCPGCIQEGEAFMQQFIDSTKVFFVLTKIESLKILQQKIGKSLKDRKNVYIDKQGIFDIPTDNSIYPCIIQLKDGKIIKHQFQSPENSQAFEWLKIQLE
ncbi:MAG: hypothetical protein H3C64_04220 [Candidatus Kuenenia stuttgartiensis]|nr:hypothetical protein [Candidatus Kuenenia stuttgartiensis]